MTDRERLSTGVVSPTSATRARRLAAGLVAGAVLTGTAWAAAAPAALADGVVIAVSVSDRPSASASATGVVPPGPSDDNPSQGLSSSFELTPGAPGAPGGGAGGGGSDDLASTGLSTFWLVGPGLLLVGAGAATVAWVRRRPAGAHAL